MLISVCRVACVLLIGLAATASGAQSLVQPLPSSSRTDPGLDPRLWPLSAVGKLNVVTGPGSRQHCTATLIGQRLALTAAHCLWDRARKRWVDPENVHFVAGYTQGQYTAHAIARAYTKPDAYAFSTEREALALDWAVVRLAEPIALKPLMLSRALGPDTAETTFTGVLHAGYKSFSNQVVSVESGCRARYLPSAQPLLDHYCNVVPGESGSALIITRDGEPAVIGILVASALVGSPHSLAVPVSNFQAAVEEALAGDGPDAAPGPKGARLPPSPAAR